VTIFFLKNYDFIATVCRQGHDRPTLTNTRGVGHDRSLESGHEETAVYVHLF